jgi:hypothetical protein
VDPQPTEFTDEEIKSTWTWMARKYGEDIAQEIFCQAFAKAKQNPLRYAAKSARYIATDERKRERNRQAYRVALSDVGLGWWESKRSGTDEHKRQRFLRIDQVVLSGVRWDDGVVPEDSETDEAPLMEFQKRSPEARIYRDPVSEVEALRLWREIKHDPSLRRLIRQAGGEKVKISASQASKARARVLKRVLAE